MKPMELTSEERTDLFLAVCTRINHIEQLLEIPSFMEDKKYKDELARMIALKNKLQYNG